MDSGVKEVYNPVTDSWEIVAVIDAEDNERIADNIFKAYEYSRAEDGIGEVGFMMITHNPFLNETIIRN